MSAWFVVPFIGMVVTDWPWLLVMVVIQWGLAFSHLGPTSWLFVGEVVVIFGIEAGLAWFLPTSSAASSGRRLWTESLTLLWLSLYLGALPGIAVWQGTVGFDAGMRVHQWIKNLVRQSLLRGVRIVLGLLLLTIIANGLLPH